MQIIKWKSIKKFNKDKSLYTFVLFEINHVFSS